ncbi:MAG: T9SS type A sorting domain-containing protein, partial [Saprospiraceae bacterium]|nr:T9SS type A sorting domain-containing protein [Saprospiraceae bacterium]
FVDVLFSYNNGVSYPDTLAKRIPNTGSATIIVPNQATTRARLKIKASDNIFFDLSDQFFTVIAEEVTSIEETRQETYWQLSPNPTFDKIAVTLKTPLLPNARMSVLDVTGKALITNILVEAETTIIDLSYAPKGVYFIRLEDDERTLVRKIILQ